MQGASIYGHLGPHNERFATTDITDSMAEVYAYTGRGTGLTYLYSFNNGLSCATNDCISAAYGPAPRGKRSQSVEVE